jgi:phosphatidylglycerophosphatase C
MPPTVVFDLDRVLLAGDATVLFVRGRLHRSPGRALRAVLAAPLLLPGAAVPGLRPWGARLLTRLLVGGGTDDATVIAAYREALGRQPEAAVADALACLRRHRAAGDHVVVATAGEETLARGYLAALGLDDVDVVGSTGRVWTPRSRRAKGEGKVTALTERGYPPPWTAVYSDSASDLPLFAGTAHPVLVNAGRRAAAEVARVLGSLPETVTWR